MTATRGTSASSTSTANAAPSLKSARCALANDASSRPTRASSVATSPRLSRHGGGASFVAVTPLALDSVAATGDGDAAAALAVNGNTTEPLAARSSIICAPATRNAGTTTRRSATSTVIGCTVATSAIVASGVFPFWAAARASMAVNFTDSGSTASKCWSRPSTRVFAHEAESGATCSARICTTSPPWERAGASMSSAPSPMPSAATSVPKTALYPA